MLSGGATTTGLAGAVEEGGKGASGDNIRGQVEGGDHVVKKARGNPGLLVAVDRSRRKAVEIQELCNGMGLGDIVVALGNYHKEKFVSCLFSGGFLKPDLSCALPSYAIRCTHFISRHGQYSSCSGAA